MLIPLLLWPPRHPPLSGDTAAPGHMASGQLYSGQATGGFWPLGFLLAHVWVGVAPWQHSIPTSTAPDRGGMLVTGVVWHIYSTFVIEASVMGMVH